MKFNPDQLFQFRIGSIVCPRFADIDDEHYLTDNEIETYLKNVDEHGQCRLPVEHIGHVTGFGVNGAGEVTVRYVPNMEFLTRESEGDGLCRNYAEHEFHPSALYLLKS